MHNGVALSLSQCNLNGHSIVIDQKQDLTDVTYTFENGRMKVSAKRAFNTGDATDLVLATGTPYYVIMAIGGISPTINVGYHGSSATQNLVCLSTLEEKYECKESAEWADEAPMLPKGDASAAPVKGLAISLMAALVAVAGMW